MVHVLVKKADLLHVVKPAIYLAVRWKLPYVYVFLAELETVIEVLSLPVTKFKIPYNVVYVSFKLTLLCFQTDK